ncbi:MAG: CBS domain-containing protein [Nitrospirae bacterium]|nr:CBS domain-containing protein [Nitrospirota bacterium]MCL5422117.1 CBS domain-containing protein [Nitrospirota bacterium]
MKTVNEVLKNKGREIWSISPLATVFQALELMADKDVGALPVVQNGKLVGIFSERDYARKVILKGRASKDTTVSELMTQTVFYVNPDNTVNECMALMTSKQIRHLPVLNRDRLVGIITLGDVVKRIISEQEFTIHELEKYVKGEYGT